jgi:hypothetical protein
MNLNFYPPIKTVGAPGPTTIPPEAVKSSILAAGIPPIITVADPFTITSTPHESPILAAGRPAINTVGAPGGIIGVGIPIVAVLTIISVILAAGSMFLVVSGYKISGFRFQSYRHFSSSIRKVNV